MALIKKDGFQITTEDADFKPIELTVKITSRELFNKLVAVVNKSQQEEETILYAVYELDHEDVNEFVDSVLTAITK